LLIPVRLVYCFIIIIIIMGGCASSDAVHTPEGHKKVKKDADEPPANGRFKYQTGTCALEFWQPVKELGEGSISSIYLVRRRPQRIDIPYRERADIMELAAADEYDKKEDLYALKSIIKAYVGNERFLHEMRNEIYTMSRLNHPSVVTVFEAYERKRHIYLVMEYCSGGDLCERVVSEAQAAWIVKQILCAVAYLHQHKVVHRDLKMENIMFDRAGQVKIIDFGLATRYLSNEHKQMRDRVGTLYSMAPQVLQGVYDAQCDLWSIGVVSYMLLSGGTQPFWGPPREMPWEKRRKIVIDRIMRCEYMRMTGNKWKDISPHAKAFVASLLQCDPKKRSTAAGALKSPWMTDHANIDASADFMTTAVASNTACQNCNYTEVAELQQSTRRLLASTLSNDEIVALKTTLKAYDTAAEGCITVHNFFAGLAQTQLTPEDVAMLQSKADPLLKIDYISLIGGILESKNRRDSERMTEALAQLHVDQQEQVPQHQISEALKEIIAESTLANVLEEVEQDEQGCVSVQDVIDLVGKKNVALIEEAMSGQDADQSEENLVDANNAVIPGGRNDPTERPEFVYDRKTGSLRKAGANE
jgi:calcium-dependent protein kinase